MPVAAFFPAVLVELETMRAAGRKQYDLLQTIRAEIERGGNEVEIAEYVASEEFILAEMAERGDKIFAVSGRAKKAGIKFTLVSGGIEFAGRKLTIA